MNFSLGGDTMVSPYKSYTLAHNVIWKYVCEEVVGENALGNYGHII